MLEVTRRCNMYCTHCLRGEPQKKDYDKNILTLLPKGRIRTLQITGGEPTLVKNLWKDLGWHWDLIRADDVWVKTNGKVFKKKWAEDFIRFTERYLPYKGITQFSVSRDQYHDDEPAVCKYCHLFSDKGLEDMFSVDDKEISMRQVIQEGRASDWGGRESKRETLENNEGCIENLIYISANGNVSIGGNNSFKTVDENNIGNILTESLDNIIERELRRNNASA